MEIKTCSQCGLPKPETDFHANGSGKRRTACASCYNANDRAKYLVSLSPSQQQRTQENRILREEFKNIPIKDKIRSYSEWQRVRRSEKLRGLKCCPCGDCGGVFQKEVMDYDHREPGEKVDNIGSLIYRASASRLKTELEKCDLVCANCHRVREARRRQGLPATLPPPEYHI